MSTRPVHAFIATAICVAAVFGSGTASAAEASAMASMHDRQPFEFKYQFDSDDLRTDRGTRRVYRELILKAQRACSSSSSSMIDLYRLDRRCAAGLVDDVVVQIGSPVLAALHAKGAATNSLAVASRGPDFAGSL